MLPVRQPTENRLLVTLNHLYVNTMSDSMHQQ